MPTGSCLKSIVIVSLLSLLSQGAVESGRAESVENDSLRAGRPPSRPAEGRIEGRVLDRRTQAPLYGANVVVLGTRRGAYTRNDGTYRIDDVPPGSYRLQFSYIGYEVEVRTDVVVSAGVPARVDEELVPIPVLADPITVRPGLFVEEMTAPPSSVSLRREEIRRFPGGFEDVVTTATALPGVAQVGGGGRNDLLVRGGGPAENLFLINGLEVPNINHFGTQGTSGGALSFINLDFVDRVEFATGGFGARYGDRMSSVLELDLRPGREDRLGGRGTISASQFGLDLEGPIGSRGSFITSVRQSYLDLIFRAAGAAFIPVYTDFNFYGESRLSERDRLSILGLAAWDRVELDRSDPKKRREIATLLDNKQDQRVLGARLRHLMADGYVEAIAGRTEVSFDLSQADTSVAAREFFRAEATEGKTSLKLELVKIPGRTTRLSGGLGIDFLDSSNRTSFADSVYDQSGRSVSRASLGLPSPLRLEESNRASHLWSQVERDLSPRLSLTVGLRADHYDALEKPLYLVPRISLRHRAGSRVTLRASAGRYVQPPSAVWLANPLNRDLRASRCDMGVVGGELLVREDTSLRLEAYYKGYRNLPGGTDPGSDSTAATDYLVLSNTGVGFGGREDNFASFGFLDLASGARGEAFGVELSARKKLSSVPCYGQAALSLGQSRYRAVNGKWYPGLFDQRYILNLSGGYVLDARWEIAARFRLIGGAPYTPVYDPRSNAARPGEIQILPEEYLSRRLGPAHQLDLRVDRRWNFSGWDLITFVDVQNVYNFRAQERPRWNFADQRIEDRGPIGILPSIGIRAVF